MVEAWAKSGLEPLPMPYQKILGDDFNESVAAAGQWELHSNPAGQGAGLLKTCQPASEIFTQLVASTHRAMHELAQRVRLA